jgi:phosphomannomutase
VNAAPIDLSAFVKAYDVRGLVGTQLTAEVVAAIGAGFVDEVEAAGRDVVVGHDMRDSSPEFAAAFARGARARGANVVSIGLCSTDESYFASGLLDAPAAMFTASHNPASYNGIKLSRAGARGISFDTGLRAIRDRAQAYLAAAIPSVDAPGSFIERDVLADYSAYLRTLVPLESIRPIKIVVDAGNGMGGLTVPAVLGTEAGLPELPIEVVPLYFELDGTFPNHEANPLEPANLVDLQKAVVEHGADLGLAFDGDADRCFVVDELGQPVNPSAVAAIVALREIQRVRGIQPDGDIVVLHNLITSRIVPETIEAAGAVAVRTRVGHSYIKDEMAATGAIFGGEHSAHYYFRDFWGADNGMLAAMHLIAQYGTQDGSLSTLGTTYTPYALSGEINSTVDDVPAAYARIFEAFTGSAGFDELDGLTVTGTVTQDEPWWWFNVRPSNTEPLLRLNAEGQTAAAMEAVRDRVLALIRG